MASSMNNASHLCTGPVNLGLVREDSRKELINLLDKCSGSKALVWDSELTEQFGLVAEYSLLKEYEVDRMFPLRSSRLPASNVQHIIFITRPVVSLMEQVSINIKKEEEGDGFGRKEYHIFFVPWKSFLCIQKLQELGVHGELTNIEEYRLDLITMDSDILSMENSSSFYDINIDEDRTSLYLVARAIIAIEKQYGVIPMLYGKGNGARAVCSMAQKMWLEEGDPSDEEHSQIDRLLVIDRTTDPISPLVTQLTYEGLIDEAFGIANCTASFPPENFSKTSKSDDLTTEKKKVLLTSKDDLYSELRDYNFNAVGPALKRRAKVISEQFEERHSAKTVGEMKQFVSHLPQMQHAKQSLAVHTSIAELIKEFTDEDDFMSYLSAEQEFLNGIGTDKVHPFIEECLFRKRPLIRVLRLICLQCITNNGLKQKVLDYYKREIIQSYGYKHLMTFHKLEKCGLLRITGGVWNYNTIRKSMKLMVEDINEKEPQDIAYVHSGYAPISVRLAQLLSHPGWRSIEELMKMLPGTTQPGIQQVKPKKKCKYLLKKKDHFLGEAADWQGSISGDSSTSSSILTLIFFIGGVTYAEISALRFLSRQNDGHEYIVASTSIINGNTLLQPLVEAD